MRKLGRLDIGGSGNSDENISVARERPRWLETELSSKQRIVAERWVTIERKVRGVHRDIVLDERAKPSVRDARVSLESTPEHSMVDEEKICFCLDCFLDCAR